MYMNKILRKYRRGWTTALAGSNENIKLELSKAWEPLDSSKLSYYCEGSRAHGLFFNGN